jgi:hypothetical protein
MAALCFTGGSPLAEIACVLVRLDHIASLIVNANHDLMGAAVKLRVADCIRFALPQCTEWERIGDEI